MMRVIELKESITASNDRDADALREEMRIEGTLLVNLMSSPGSGKTTLLSRIIEDLGGEWKIAVLEADIDAQVDAEQMEEKGARSIQVHTDGMCHMDAGMTRTGLRAALRNLIPEPGKMSCCSVCRRETTSRSSIR